MKKSLLISSAVLVFALLMSCDSDKDRAGRFFLMANESMKTQNYKEAIRLYTEAITKNPELKEAYNNRGVALSKTQHYAEAINDFTYAIVQLDPEYTDAYQNRFDATLASGNPERALEDAEYLNKTFPDSAYTFFYKGLAFTELKQYEKAVNAFQTAFEMNPSDVEALVNQANAYYMAGKLDQAEQLLGKAVELDASEPRIYNTYSLIYTQKGDFEKALAYVNQAIEKDRLNPYFNNNRGFIYLNMGDYEKAEEDINLGIKSDPRNPWAYRNKAIFYFKTESYEAALRNVEQAAIYDDEIPLLNYYWGTILFKLNRNEEGCSKLKVSLNSGEELGKELFAENCKS